MHKSSTWLPINDLGSWNDYSFEQSANWHCAELASVDTLPCTGDYMMVGRESLSEALINAFGYDYYQENFNQPDGDTDHLESVNDGNLQSGSFEFMKYKLWTAISGSSQSACYYGRLDLERTLNLNLAPYTNWPCPIHESRLPKIGGGFDADSGSFPFAVAVEQSDGDITQGVILSSEYIISDTSGLVRVAYGIQPHESFSDLFNGSHSKVVDVINTIPIENNTELYLSRVSPPMVFGRNAQPALISDCSGPSNPIVGERLALFGLGYDTLNDYNTADTMQVVCGQVYDPSVCASIAAGFGLTESICMTGTPCSWDWGGPIMAKQGNDNYLVGIIYLAYSATTCTG